MPASVDLLTLELEIKKYIVKKPDPQGAYFELAPKGVAHLKDEHPTVLMYWKRLLQLSPPSVSLLVASCWVPRSRRQGVAIETSFTRRSPNR